MAHLLPSSIRFAAMILLVWLIAACAVNRQDGGGPTYDMMENLTARYNIVYHGRKIIADVERDNAAAHRDNYQQLLPVFVEPTAATASSNAKLVDSVINKAQHIINKKTESNYINEAYLLMGKANYLRRNYYHAAEFFTYVANTFGDMPKYRQAALVWKARSLMQLGNLTQAGSVLDTVFSGLESEKESVGLAFATQAQYELLMHDEKSAIAMLQQALEHARHKPTKLRWHFLLGQLLQRQDRPAEAYQHYRRVVHSNAPYEMSFHAGLNRVYLATEHDSGADRVKLLQRMLRDGKNKDFRDQIHYQIAEVLYADSLVSEALTHYELALRWQSGNWYQTTLTYLRLADYYFDTADYQTAKGYYDSVGMSIPVDFPDAGIVQRKIANVDELITLLQTVAHQDSLQQLARLPQTERLAVVDTLAAHAYAMLQSEKKTVSKPTGRPIQRSPFDDVLTSMAAYADNRFYFNNPDAMGMGMSEFRRRWGNRQLRDNWRFSDRTGDVAMLGGVEAAIAKQTDVAAADSVWLDRAAWTLKWRESYIEELPDTEEKMVASHSRIHDALLHIGNLYRDELRDNAEAITAYEALLERYPDSKETPAVYYNLYRLYADVDEAQAERYKTKLLEEFPNARYSHVVRDPMYLAKLEQQKQLLDRAYEQVYTQYVKGEYPGVITAVSRLLDEGTGISQTRSQLAYLRALAWGRTSPVDTFEHALRQIVRDFPDDSLVTPLVRQHLAFIETNRDTLTTRLYALQGIDENRERFVDEPTITPWPQLVINQDSEAPRPRREAVVQELLPDSATYYFVINVMNERVNLASSRFGIGQFNRTRYAGSRISHQLKMVNNENQLIYIGPFVNYDDAKQYETRILPALSDIMKVPNDIYNTFVITERNFGTLSDFDKIDDYHAAYQSGNR